MLFVAVIAAAFALFLHLGIITVKIGNVDLADFAKSIGVALLLGFVAGITQKALSVQLIEQRRRSSIRRLRAAPWVSCEAV